MLPLGWTEVGKRSAGPTSALSKSDASLIHSNSYPSFLIELARLQVSPCPPTDWCFLSDPAQVIGAGSPLFCERPRKTHLRTLPAP